MAFIVICLVMAFCFENKSTNLKADAYKTYVSSIEGVSIDPKYSVVDLGFCYEITSNNALENSNNILGTSKIFNCKLCDINKILNSFSFSIKERYSIENVLVFEGIDRNGNKMQVAYSNGRLTVGSPVIFGSY